MTCSSDLVANPAVLDDPDSTGQVLYWSCCGLHWYLSPTEQQEPRQSYQAWHFAAGALTEAGLL